MGRKGHSFFGTLKLTGEIKHILKQMKVHASAQLAACRKVGWLR